MNTPRVGVSQSRPDVGTNAPGATSHTLTQRMMMSERRFLLARAKTLQDERSNVLQRVRDIESELGIDSRNG